MAWIDDAACRGVDTEVFFPPERIGRGGGHGYDARPALALCRACPVRQACLDAALDEEKNAPSSTYGIRGGLTQDERRQILRRRTGYKPEPRQKVSPHERLTKAVEEWRGSARRAATAAAFDAITDRPDPELAASRRAMLEAR
ncbi:WhiB family transcriptional regulator [Sanguibacter massiliensis]|uniref:WhiB family transcriptional regulator n=1 Tax=Sanguibacter massiliensis TaxID=1973217 RepID=UPI000C84A671|nr:WhiB family transcriptional regulator [Sanguibacter massiliensis]